MDLFFSIHNKVALAFWLFKSSRALELLLVSRQQSITSSCLCLNQQIELTSRRFYHHHHHFHASASSTLLVTNTPLCVSLQTLKCQGGLQSNVTYQLFNGQFSDPCLSFAAPSWLFSKLSERRIHLCRAAIDGRPPLQDFRINTACWAGGCWVDRKMFHVCNSHASCHKSIGRAR